MPLLLLGALLAAHQVAIYSESACLQAQDVRDRLEAVASGAVIEPTSVTLSHVRGRLSIEIIYGDSVVRREIATGASCAEDATIAATVIATWQQAPSRLPLAPSVPLAVTLVARPPAAPRMTLEVAAA